MSTGLCNRKGIPSRKKTPSAQHQQQTAPPEYCTCKYIVRITAHRSNKFDRNRFHIPCSIFHQIQSQMIWWMGDIRNNILLGKDSSFMSISSIESQLKDLFEYNITDTGRSIFGRCLLLHVVLQHIHLLMYNLCNSHIDCHLIPKHSQFHKKCTRQHHYSFHSAP